MSREEERQSSQPAGYLFGKVGLLVILALLLLAAWFEQLVIVIILGLVLSAAGLSRLWSQYSLAGVNCERWLSERRIFPGESVELRLRLVNRKLLPLPWIQVEDTVPATISPGNAPLPDGHPGGILNKSAALLWYTSINWKESLTGTRRGYYTLGPISLTSGDIFGLYPRTMTVQLFDHLIVYPRIFPIAHLVIPPRYPIGEAIAERRIFEDPVRVVGVRDYTPHDSLRHIHWKASARHQQLQVKVFEPTTTLNMAVFLAVDTFSAAYAELFDVERFELGISTAASVAAHLIERRISVGMFINSQMSDSGEPVGMLPGSNTGRLVEILEAMAMVTNRHSTPFEEFLQAELSGLPWGTTLVIIVSRPSISLTDLLAELQEKGHRMMVLQVGGPGENEPVPDIAWYHVGQAGNFIKAGYEATL